MTNRHRGEIKAILNGREWTLRLTLGALAEVEDALGGEDILSLAQRLGEGRIRTKDCIYLLGAALRGAGHKVSDDEVRAMHIEGGVEAMVHLVGNLLSMAFSGKELPSSKEVSSPSPTAL